MKSWPFRRCFLGALMILPAFADWYFKRELERIISLG